MLTFIKELLIIRGNILQQLQELQSDLEDFSDVDLVECRDTMLHRVNECLEILEESDEDNQ